MTSASAGGQASRRGIVNGRITIDEFEDRFDAVHAATYEVELRAPLHGCPADKVADLRKRDDVLVLEVGNGGLKREGAWDVPARIEVSSSKGTIELDFSKTQVSHPVVEIELTLGKGWATLVLPSGATANVDGLLASKGSITCKLGSQPAKGVPHFIVTGRLRTGSITVRKPRSFPALTPDPVRARIR